MVQRFADETSALGIAPSPPRLADVTRTLARAVESLPRLRKAHELGQQIDAEAHAMETPGTAAQEAAHARRSLALALQAIEGMQKPAGTSAERRRALEEAHQAIDALEPASRSAESRAAIENAYRAVGHVMLLVVSGQVGVAARASDLGALVTRFAVQDAEQACRTGAQVLFAMAAAFDALPSPSSKVRQLAAELRSRAGRLASATALDYSAQLKEALAVAESAIAAVEKAQRFSALEILRTQAHTAIAAISAERPFELQRPAVQDAFRLLADALTVAAAR
ncbi:MAG: hypothetical protein JWN44_2383 [Myxococcales bacterium]|nr:hypothetical protein [Myxococcales bacterium]